MKRLGKTTKVLLTAAVAAMALSALVASSASASIVAGKFSSSTIKMTTSSITLKRNGTEAKACTPYGDLTGETTGDFYYAWTQLGGAQFNCSGIELHMAFHGEATFDTVAKKYTLTLLPHCCETQESPWGQYFQESTAKGTWVNGSGATASAVTFTEAPIGYDSVGKKLTLTGTFKATTSSGALLTLSH